MIGRLIRLGVLGTTFVLAACKADYLMQNLDQTQANEVMAALYRHNIPAKKVGTVRDGFSVEVGRADFAAAVDILKTYDLPSSKSVNVADMFPADSLVASPRAERARLLSAVEQRLQQSVRALNGVVSARVHVAYDLEESSGATSTTRISVLVVHDDAVSIQALVSDIKRLLKNSMPKLEYDNISVVPSRQSGLQHAPPHVAGERASPVRPYAVAAAIASLGVVSASVLYGWSRSGGSTSGRGKATAMLGKLRRFRGRESDDAGNDNGDTERT
ncbi:type III secretion inner membrane ring lipoprotein SctJ [Burkholderia dolosa]|uniref:Lipoprotein n=1 Tax=Burkholderia dolosa TaxID=152500 RepID=A0A892IFN7_9BURK|nr:MULTISPECIES: type III secretion inner membrane ring lipoprotein SctJ [Burkholderia]AJY10237.1 type III secretion apparatus lipoprotein, YscJ/HrcJ family [Burkholderia dolosa AU0158]AYZ94373.1 EscJ/YscJ/HrcJ family type III secretion inner membrane ring protein [Burkholderia dolosa]MBR8415781.1 type III secretion inner membrane ring lipoprotein SctJ [Burkholderia dolosa]MBY4659574.1 type III secretion inner membrane ring lipoprotein SctJ [Burkholderia dolosa]MBY4690704.1 type III secretion 